MIAERDLTLAPSVPGPGHEVWRCKCGKMLGIVYRGWFYSRHNGREIAACLPVRVQCERCGGKQTRDTS